MASREALAAARVKAARAALAKHDELRRANAKGDGFELGFDDLPLDATGWLEWHDNEYKPAYQAWSDAMDRLLDVLGPEFPGRHPFRFRPVCERIVAGDNDSDDSREGER
jgi:hypothetical protein